MIVPTYQSIQMKSLPKPFSAKVSIPLNCLNKVTIKKIINNKRKYKLKNFNAQKMDSLTKMSEVKKRKASKDSPSLSAQESDAQLLLILSNSTRNEASKQKEHPSHESNESENNCIKDLPKKEIEKAELVVLDEDSDGEKAGKKKAIENNTDNLKDDQCETNQIYNVSREDYDLLKIIKAKGMTRQLVSRLATDDLEGLVSGPQPEDVNNNSQVQSNLEIPLIDLSLEDNDSLIDEENVVSKILSYSEQNKALVNKWYETFRAIEAKPPEQQEKTAVAPAQQTTFENHINVSNIVMEVMTNVNERCQGTSFKLYYNKITQTPPVVMREVSCSTHDAPDTTDEDENIKMNLAKRDDATKNFENTTRQSPNNMQSVVKDTPVKIQHVPISPVPTKQTYGTQDQQQMMNQFTPQPLQPMVQSANNYNNYPNTRMVNVLELSDQQHLQHNNCANNCNSNYGAEGGGPTIGQQQHFLPTAAANSIASQLASFAAQQNAGSNTQAPVINTQQPVINTQQSVSQSLSEIVWQSETLKAQYRSRRLKNTPTRGAPYQVPGPQFPAPSMGKYQMLMEQQKMRPIIDQQRAWESQLQNYPNTAWGQSYKRSF